jgi:hypothetical protein
VIVESKVTFGKVQTNRASLKKYMELFKRNKQGDESFISPRPKPGTYQEHYFALLRFSEETKNNIYFKSLKGFKTLSEEDYKKELELIKFYWEA